MFEPCGHFVLRTPLLPLNTLDGARGDLATGRAWLATLLERKEVLAAFAVASPSLSKDIAVWRKDPTTDRGIAIERALMAYAQRIAERCTPFGLFAGVSLGRLGERTELTLSGSMRRKTRIDMAALHELCEHALQDAQVRRATRYFTNETLVRVGETLHFVQGSQNKKERVYHLAATSSIALVETLLAFCAHGATGEQLAAEIVRMQPEVTTEEASEFVQSLIAEQLVVAELRPILTAEEAGPELAAQLLRVGSPLAEPLRACLETIEAVDRAEIGTQDGEALLIPKLAALGITAEPGKLLQVDLWKETQKASISSSLTRTLIHTAELLTSVFRIHDPLREARAAFEARYEGAEVPLLVAADAELGIANVGGSGTLRDSPLLRDIALHESPRDKPQHRPALAAFLSSLFARIEKNEVVITEQELVALKGHAPAMPESFSMLCSLFDPTNRTDPHAFLHTLTGPSSEMLNGRMAWLDPALESASRSAIKQEEALRPEAIFFDIVHSPAGRIGNVIARPHLRDYELALLGRPGASEAYRLPLSDVMLSLRDGRFVLTSQSRGCELVPRLTTAHNTRLGFSLYRFLAALRDEGTPVAPLWDWDVHQSTAFTPRVRLGRVVIQAARWGVFKNEMDALTSADDVRAMAEHKGWPRFVRAREDDNSLPVDLQSDLSVEAFLNTYKKRGGALVEEDLSRLFAPATTGPGGGYSCEAVISCRATARIVPPLPKLVRTPIQRTFAPGSEWLFAKIYTGSETADQLLTGPVADLVKRTREQGIKGWFFIRYHDPDYHLRLRFNGDARWLWSDFQSQLLQTFSPLVDKGVVHRIVLDTYVREVERYAGPQGIAVCEKWFEAESDAVVALLASGASEDERWRWCLRAVHDGFEALGLSLDEQIAALREVRAGYFAEHNGDAATEDSLSAKFRPLRAELSKRVFEGESSLRAQLHAIAGPLRDNAVYGSRANLAASLAHMCATRALKFHVRAQELVIYDFLLRLLQSERARKAKT